jgi:hypothetical protein
VVTPVAESASASCKSVRRVGSEGWRMACGHGAGKDGSILP